ncbi:MAG: exonuclease domain-containing protein [Candidatus Peribacteraceae bacterium]|nr:exonuclease domain-containing protein [Candidatus Peribacteraceae bacterium]MDD5741812.1 exonuclease domain-containing protein [Candidatus Peribacteraceae bacterium]
MKLPPLPLVVLDTETTGFVPRVNRVIEFASVQVQGGKILEEYETLISIPEDVPPTVRMLTHITPQMLTDKPSFDQVREMIRSKIGENTVIVGQNVGFDIRMLKGEGIDLTERPWIDTSMLASMVFPELPSYSLGYVSTVLKLNHDPVHRALGDVHATLELLGKCWERLCELPPDELRTLFEIFSLSSSGYRRLAEVLPTTPAAKRPKWMLSGTRPSRGKKQTSGERVSLPDLSRPGVTLIEDSLAPRTLQRIVDTVLAAKEPAWIVVKNLETSVRGLTLPEEVSVLMPAPLLLNPEAAETLLLQQSFTADEATLAVKLRWYRPRAHRDLPVHGEERAVWYGKLACTETSPAYQRQFDPSPRLALIDHQQLLSILENPDHPGRGALSPATHLLVTDASMLEDTATKAFKWQAVLDHLRAAAEGRTDLTGFLDLLQLWIERVRAFQDVRYLTGQDLDTKETRLLRERLAPFITDETLPELPRMDLIDLDRILTPESLSHRIAWIEQRQGGSQSIQSVPERIGPLLSSLLYEEHPTILCVPPGSSGTLREILPATGLTADQPFPPSTLPLSIRTDIALDDLLRNPPPGKSVILVGSRRIIEEKYVEYTPTLEAKGVELICQNLSGGLERMTAEFLAAPAPTLWLLTPWSYEEVDLPAEIVDRLIIASLPFDHPSHTVLSRRAVHYPNAFEDYFLPRLEHRLFRLLRTFCRHRTFHGEVLVTDDRLKTKSYGRRVMAYLQQFAHEDKDASKMGKPQMELF